jgi:bacillopeptidase F
VAVLAGVVVTTVTGVLPRVVSALGEALGGIADQVLVTTSPEPSLAPVVATPRLTAPENPYTNRPTTTLTGTVPADVAGRAGFVVRVYVALPDQDPVAIRDVPVGATATFVVEDLPLEPGRNDVSVALVGPGGESDPSPSVTVVFDRSKPRITITSPRDGATVNAATVKITGKTQGRSTVVARNEATGTARTGRAAANGGFTVEVPLRQGRNAIALTATDPAGNVGTAVITVRRGSGKLAVALSASAYRISAARLPRTIELRVQVTDPDGRLMAGQAVTFTLSIPGVSTITGEDVTDTSGAASFRTTIPAGATVGSGLATAYVSTLEFGQSSGRVAITIIE